MYSHVHTCVLCTGHHPHLCSHRARPAPHTACIPPTCASHSGKQWPSAHQSRGLDDTTRLLRGTLGPATLRRTRAVPPGCRHKPGARPTCPGAIQGQSGHSSLRYEAGQQSLLTSRTVQTVCSHASATVGGRPDTGESHQDGGVGSHRDQCQASQPGSHQRCQFSHFNCCHTWSNRRPNSERSSHDEPKEKTWTRQSILQRHSRTTPHPPVPNPGWARVRTQELQNDTPSACPQSWLGWVRTQALRNDAPSACPQSCPGWGEDTGTPERCPVHLCPVLSRLGEDTGAPEQHPIHLSPVLAGLGEGTGTHRAITLPSPPPSSGS